MIGGVSSQSFGMVRHRCCMLRHLGRLIKGAFCIFCALVDRVADMVVATNKTSDNMIICTQHE